MSFLCLKIQAAFFGILEKGLKNGEIKMELAGFEPKAFPMQKGRSITELHPLHSHVPLSYNPNCIFWVFGKGFEKHMK